MRDHLYRSKDFGKKKMFMIPATVLGMSYFRVDAAYNFRGVIGSE